MGNPTLGSEPTPRRLLTGIPQAGAAILLLLLAAAPSYGQAPAACTVPYLSGPNISIPPDRPDAVEGRPFGAVSFSSRMTDSRTFEGTLRARAADSGGLGILLCIFQQDCSSDALFDWLRMFWDWGTFAKGETARFMDVAYQGPAGSRAQVHIEGSLDGLVGVAAAGAGVASTKVSAYVWALQGEGPWRDVFEEVSDDATAVAGARFTHVHPAPGGLDVTLTPGELLRLEAVLRAEATTYYVTGYGAAIGISQFLDSPGTGFPYIPNPGLRVTATIANVSPVLSTDHASVDVVLGLGANNSGVLCDGDGDAVQLSASEGTVTNNGNGTWSWSLTGSANFDTRTVTITANDNHGGVGQVAFNLVPRLSIDIKPKTPRNVIDLRSEGKVPVAILAGSGFNPLVEVERTSLRFGRSGDEDSLLRVGDGTKAACSGADVNGDGLGDLVCDFQVALTGFYCGESTGILKAVLPASGTSPVEGRDYVAPVPCRSIQVPTVIHDGPPLSGTPAGVAVSPDGTTLYVALARAIFSLPASGGLPVQLNTADLGDIVGLAVSRDGSSVFASVRDGGLAATNPVVVSVPVAGGPAALLANLPAGSNPGGLAVSPDGTTLLIAMGGHEIFLVPVPGGAPINVLSYAGAGSVNDVAISSSGETLYLGVDSADQIYTIGVGGWYPSLVPTGIAFADPVNIAISPSDSTLFVLDSSVRVDPLGNVVASGGQVGAAFMGPSSGGVYLPLVLGGPDFNLVGRIAVSPDGATLYFVGQRRGTLETVVFSVPTGLAP